MDGRKLDRCSRPAPSLYKSRHTDIAATLSAMCVQPQHTPLPKRHAPPHIVPHLSSPHTSPIKAPLATTGHPRNCRRESERGQPRLFMARHIPHRKIPKRGLASRSRDHGGGRGSSHFELGRPALGTCSSSRLVAAAWRASLRGTRPAATGSRPADCS